MTDWTQLVTETSLEVVAKERKCKSLVKNKIKKCELDGYKDSGWTVTYEYANGTYKLEKPKPYYDVFENEVWMVFYKMGFPIMNGDHDIKIEFGFNSKKIDVMAMDDETCIFVECKSTQSFQKKVSFKKELESINGYYKDLCDAVTKEFGPRKFKYIFATKNYFVADDSEDMKKIKGFNLSYFDYDTVLYYDALTEHLGKAARYQFLGNVFQNEEIPNIKNEVPAMRGIMGGVNYYSFLIEPETLLKLGYVLHRNKANHLLMPTYQRLIKKDRLKAITKFVNDGGYFPNSLIVSIDTHGESLQFDVVGKDSDLPAVGTLHLPQEYHSMYIIDGQHRLYGYSGSDCSSKDVIPVVAFENLPSEKQVQMFMEINENQKAVSKSLRNTLNVDLLWNSKEPKQRKEALMLKVAEALGEDKKSPLYERVLTGEDTQTEIRVITTEYLKDAIKQSSFLNEYDKNGIKKAGVFDKNDNDLTFPVINEFLISCLTVIAENCEEEWNKGANGFLAINNTSYALIRIIDDILNIQLESVGKSVIDDVNEAVDLCKPMLFDLASVVNTIDEETKNKIKKAKGGSAKKEAWRVLQVALNQNNPKFINKELQTYIEDYCTENNPQASGYIYSIEKLFKEEFKATFANDADWLVKYAPEALGRKVTQVVADINFKKKVDGLELVDEWEVISFDELYGIGTYKTNWTDFAQKILARPSLKNSKKETLTWLVNLSNYKKKTSKGLSLTKSEFSDLEEIYKDFFEEKPTQISLGDIDGTD